MTAKDPYSARGYQRFAVACILGLLIGFGGWAVGAQLSGSVAASGEVDIDQHRHSLRHPEGGMIREILVTEGDVVASGQVLLRLEADQELSERAVLQMRHLDSLALRARLEAERDARSVIHFPAELVPAGHTPSAVTQALEDQQALLDARNAHRDAVKTQLTKRRAQIAQQIDGIDAQLRALEHQRLLVIEERETQATLQERGLTQMARGLALDRERARLEGDIGALQGARAGAQERALEAEAQITSLDTQHREEITRELGAIIAAERELAERLRALDIRIAARTLEAPIAGTVHGLQVTRAQTVLRAGEPALFLIPQDSQQIIVARVAPSSIRQVFEGQSALITLAGPAQRALPQLTARVIRISADRFTEEPTQQPYYRVELELEAHSHAALDSGVLVPGLPVEVFFETRKQRPISYLTEPLTAFFRHALREG